MKHQTWLVAKNIYRNRIKGAGFWALVISPFLLVAVSLLVGLIVSSGSSQTPELAVVHAPAVTQILKTDKQLSVNLSNLSSKSEAKAKLKDGKIDGFLLVSQDGYRLITNTRSNIKFDETSLTSALTQANIAQTANRLQLTAADLKVLLTPARLTIEKQTATGTTTGGDVAAGANVAVGTIASIFIFALLMLYVGIIGQEIGNEKSSRIMETLLAATSSNVQYYGKIIGVIMLTVTQIGIYVLGFALAYPFVKGMAQVRALSGMLSGITLAFGSYVVLMMIVGILGYLFLASIVASLVNEQAQVQQATQPIAFLSMIGYIGGIAGAAVPGNVILKILSFVPFISPTLMTSRYAIQYSSTTEAWCALGLQLIGTLAVAKAGEKIYARNVLSYSDGKIIRQLFNNIRGKGTVKSLSDQMVKSEKDSGNGIKQKLANLQSWRLILLLIIIAAVLIYHFFMRN